MFNCQNRLDTIFMMRRRDEMKYNIVITINISSFPDWIDCRAVITHNSTIVSNVASIDWLGSFVFHTNHHLHQTTKNIWRSMQATLISNHYYSAAYIELIADLYSVVMRKSRVTFRSNKIAIKRRFVTVSFWNRKCQKKRLIQSIYPIQILENVPTSSA